MARSKVSRTSATEWKSSYDTYILSFVTSWSVMIENVYLYPASYFMTTIETRGKMPFPSMCILTFNKYLYLMLMQYQIDKV